MILINREEGDEQKLSLPSFGLAIQTTNHFLRSCMLHYFS